MLKLLLLLLLGVSVVQGGVAIGARWPTKDIPYVLDKSLNKNQLEMWPKAVAHVARFTSIRWVKRTTQKNYVLIRLAEKGPSRVGSIGFGNWGQHNMYLQPSIDSIYVILHEMWHVLGFQHEEYRADREKWIEIVKPCYKGGLMTIKGHDLGTPWDWRTVVSGTSQTYSSHIKCPYFKARDPKEQCLVEQFRNGHWRGFRGISMIDQCEVETYYKDVPAPTARTFERIDCQNTAPEGKCFWTATLGSAGEIVCNAPYLANTGVCYMPGQKQHCCACGGGSRKWQCPYFRQNPRLGKPIPTVKPPKESYIVSTKALGRVKCFTNSAPSTAGYWSLTWHSKHGEGKSVEECAQICAEENRKTSWYDQQAGNWPCGVFALGKKGVCGTRQRMSYPPQEGHGVPASWNNKDYFSPGVTLCWNLAPITIPTTTTTTTKAPTCQYETLAKGRGCNVRISYTTAAEKGGRYKRLTLEECQRECDKNKAWCFGVYYPSAEPGKTKKCSKPNQCLCHMVWRSCPKGAPMYWMSVDEGWRGYRRLTCSTSSLAVSAEETALSVETAPAATSVALLKRLFKAMSDFLA